MSSSAFLDPSPSVLEPLRRGQFTTLEDTQSWLHHALPFVVAVLPPVKFPHSSRLYTRNLT